MKDIERAQAEERIKEGVEHWPTLTEALGCLDCGFLFRRAVDHTCPLCGSRGEMLNVAEFFNESKLKEKREAEQQSGPTTVNPSVEDSGLKGTEIPGER